eukprot:TRINITY_DN200_c0_g1_i2.p1 TRINITY_DN200_c0_g1~~TRINITY_DN200_c0_g1_i2.p1  ORF type:complete len:936 (-),score=275.18 TRINITY_DN200_c0_g1_i2:47-2854(-)
MTGSNDTAPSTAVGYQLNQRRGSNVKASSKHPSDAISIENDKGKRSMKKLPDLTQSKTRGFYDPLAGLQSTLPDDDDEMQQVITLESHKTCVYEVKPYYSHSVLTITFFVYFFWSLGYFAYRAAETLNDETYFTLAYSVAFIIVEFVSFVASILHLNNFTNPVTNILVEKLPDILRRQKKDYPNVNAYICCYKEPPSIVAETMMKAMSLTYPADKLTVGILDDSSNFRETRGWAHVQSMERNFLTFLLRQSVYLVYDANAPDSTIIDDPQGALKETEERLKASVKEAIDSEVQWFVEYFLLNAWAVASEADHLVPAESLGMPDNSERELLAELRADDFSAYRTFTEEDLERLDRFTIDGLQVLWHGSAFFRPLVRAVLWRRSGLSNYLRSLNMDNKLRYVTPEALSIAHYRVLCLGREVVPNDVVSAGNIRIDFEPTGEVYAPRGSYLRRRKPAIPHNKAGNINNALFNESTESDMEFILLLDADQQPHPDFLLRTLPYFYADSGANTAFIQTPQFFKNIYPADDPLGHRNMEFYGPVMEGRGAYGAAPFVGTNAVFRRRCLCEVGGIMYNSVTEDMYTGMKLHTAGYKSLYHNEVLALGSAPVDIKETLEQRKRWAQGAVEIFSLTPWNLLRRRLGMRKMLYNLDSCIYPFLSPTAFFYGLSPLLMCLWAVPIVVEDPVIFVIVGVLPVMILPRVINYMILRAKRPHEENRVAQSLWVEPTDLWRAEQTYFAFAGTYLSSWHAGRLAIKNLIRKYNVKRSLSMWNWNREFLNKPTPKVDVTAPAALTKAATATKKPAAKKKGPTEQTFRTSIKDGDQIKNTRLFMWNVALFAINIFAMVIALLRFNCHPEQIWLLVVVWGFAFSTCWHLWSFIPMAIRSSENQWPYASSYHAHNIMIGSILGILVVLFLAENLRICDIGQSGGITKGIISGYKA